MPRKRSDIGRVSSDPEQLRVLRRLERWQSSPDYRRALKEFEAAQRAGAAGGDRVSSWEGVVS